MEYYVLFWQMVFQTNNSSDYGCQEGIAKTLGKADVYDIKNIHNRTAFKRWLGYWMYDLPRIQKGWRSRGCDFRMNHIFKTMEMMNSITLQPNYDCLIRKETQVADLKGCLEIFEQSWPKHVNWTAFEQRSKIVTGRNKRKMSGYGCFYDEESQKLVQDEDQWLLNRFGYEFKQLSMDNCSLVVT